MTVKTIKVGKSLTCRLDGQGLEAGKEYFVSKIRVEEVLGGIGLLSSAVIREEDYTLRAIKNAHLAFDIKAYA